VPDAIDLTRTAPPEPSGTQGDTGGFAVHLANFEGPFDLLLRLIAKHQLDITEVALSEVTDEFLGYVKEAGAGGDLDHTSSFLVVAATLLDLKAARLLPSGDVEDEADLALLEARDLLFARLLQYRAYKQVAAVFDERLRAESRRWPRTPQLDERLTAALPQVLIGLGAEELAALAAQALQPRPQPVLGLGHLHVARVSVREQAALLVPRLRRAGRSTFRSLCADSPSTLVTVARFLALLDLYREGAVELEQTSSYGELSVVWTGADEGEVAVGAGFDDQAGPVADRWDGTP
jgi:segregation and condensation protein A